MKEFLSLLTHERLTEVIHYDEFTGIFTRINVNKYNKSRRFYITGSNISKKRTHYYTSITIDKVQYKAHRLAWFYINREWPNGYIDHINGIQNDNRYCNLRVASPAQNTRNSKVKINNKTGLKGITYMKRDGRWRARLTVNYKERFIGYFDTKEAAKEARDEYAKRLHGEFFRS